MPIQIDSFETSVDIMPPNKTTAQPPERGTQAIQPAQAPELRDAVMKILADELESFSRMRGH